MAHKIKLEVVSPEKTVFSDDVNMVIARSTGGEIGILPNHAPLIASLTTEFFRILTDDGEKTLAVTGGFIEVQPKKITVIAVTAETPEEIDVDRAQKALERAKERLAQRKQENCGQTMTEEIYLRALKKRYTLIILEVLRNIKNYSLNLLKK